MRPGRRYVIFGVGLVFAAPPRGVVAGDVSPVLSAPRRGDQVMSPQELLVEYEQRLNQHSFEAVEPLIASDAVFWFNDGSYAGVEAIRGAFERTFAAFPLERYWLEDVRWIASGDTAAACIYRFRWTTTKEGRELTGGGRGTSAFRFESGAWKIVHEHLSQEPRKPAA